LVLQRIVQLVFVLLAVTFLTFSLLSLVKGDVAATLLQTEAGNVGRYEAIREDLNLDDPVPVRYVKWLGDALHGDLGLSYGKNDTVAHLIKETAPVTLALIVYAQIIAFGLAIPLGILTAYKSGGWFDRITNTSAFAMLSLPNFILGVLLVYFFALKLGWFPAIVASDVEVTDIHSLFLPALTLALGQVAVYMRLLRTDMIATLQEDFIGMAKAKGMSTRHILLRHAFRPSSLSLLTVAGIAVGQLIAGSVIVEQIFAIQGLGFLLVDSIFRRDLLVVQGIVVVVAVGFVVVNFVVDLLYAALDPRIRHARAIA